MNVSNLDSNSLNEDQQDGYEVKNDDHLGTAVVREEMHTYLGSSNNITSDPIEIDILSSSLELERYPQKTKKICQFWEKNALMFLLFGLFFGFVTVTSYFAMKFTIDDKGTSPVDCTELYYRRQVTTSGVYIICPWNRSDPNFPCVQVYCDMETDGGGWTVIQRRQSGKVSFERNWKDYKLGFGDVPRSYWIGNDIIHQLTKEKTSSLYIEITSLNKTNMFMRFDFFFVNNENNGYRLNVSGKATGSLEDKIRYVPFSDVINNARFTTFDKDNDRSPGNCATEHRGGWWFNYCGSHDVFLNGLYPPEEWHQPWDLNGSYVSSTKMMTRGKKL